MKKRRSDVIFNLKLIFYLMAILIIFIISIHPKHLNAEVLFSDNFNRTNSLDVGGNWTELSEVTTAQYINGYLVAAGYYEVRDSMLAFHGYNDYGSSVFPKPYMTAPLAHPINAYPVNISYKFTVNSNEALCFGLALMSSASGMTCANNCAVDSYKAPMNGIIFRASRSSSYYSNSVFGVLLYENGSYYWPASTFLDFQFTAGVEYSVNVMLYENYATINLTDTLGNQASMTTSQFSLNFPLDKVLIYNDAGLISGHIGDFIMYFDDVIITDPNASFNQSPVIDSFVGTPSSGVAQLSVNFTCAAHDPDGTVSGYTINYGDGTTSESNSSGSFTHTYNTAGSYQVTCAVVDNLGATTISNGTIINVSAPPPSNQPPVIDSFSVYPNSGNALIPFNFTCAAHDPDGTVNGYTIDYGDGTTPETNTTGTFTHVFGKDGIFQTTCAVVDNAGDTTVSNIVTVTVLPGNVSLDVKAINQNDYIWYNGKKPQPAGCLFTSLAMLIDYGARYSYDGYTGINFTTVLEDVRNVYLDTYYNSSVKQYLAATSKTNGFFPSGDPGTFLAKLGGVGYNLDLGNGYSTLIEWNPYLIPNLTSYDEILHSIKQSIDYKNPIAIGTRALTNTRKMNVRSTDWILGNITDNDWYPHMMVISGYTVNPSCNDNSDNICSFIVNDTWSNNTRILTPHKYTDGTKYGVAFTHEIDSSIIFILNPQDDYTPLITIKAMTVIPYY